MHLYFYMYLNVTTKRITINKFSLFHFYIFKILFWEELLAHHILLMKRPKFVVFLAKLLPEERIGLGLHDEERLNNTNFVFDFSTLCI